MQIKTKPFTFFVLSIILALSLVITPGTPVQAQTGSGSGPWSEILGADGSINFDNLTDLGTMDIENLEWMSIDLLGSDFQFTASFHRYLTPSGNIVVLPDAPTMLLMMIHPEESGLNQMLAGMGIDPGTGTALAMSGNMYQDMLAGYVDWDQFTGTEFEDPEDFFAALTNGDLDNWTWIIGMTPEEAALALANGDITAAQYSLLDSMDLLRFNEDLMSIASGSSWRYMAMLLYSPGSMDCDNIPGGCPENLCLIAPQVCSTPFCQQHPELCGKPSPCPASTVTLGNPTLRIYPIAPPSPLVVGQDPEKRGADIQVEATIPPTIYSYYIPISVYGDVQYCVLPDGNESDPILDCKTDPSRPANNGMLTMVRELVRIDCEHHVDTYAEPIAGVNAAAQMTRASKDWIRENLSAYYYGADVLQEMFNLIPGLGVANVSCDASKVCRASAFISRVQFRDPGVFGLALTVQTAGTPVTSGRVLNGNGQIEISFLSVRLIETAR
jgi:hypothetical protein